MGYGGVSEYLDVFCAGIYWRRDVIINVIDTTFHHGECWIICKLEDC